MMDGGGGEGGGVAVGWRSPACDMIVQGDPMRNSDWGSRLFSTQDGKK